VNKLKRKQLLIILTSTLVIVAAYLSWTKLSTKPPYLVNNPIQETDPIQDGVYVNRLVILGSGNDGEIKQAIMKYQGEIILKVKETETYEVKFPVNNLDELNEIKDNLNRKGIKTVNDYTIDSDKLNPAGPQ
jgi:hypothetical protein